MAAIRGRQILGAALLIAVSGTMAAPASADLYVFDDGSGLSAEAEFLLLGPTTLGIRLKNTSTSIPMGFNNSDQILTGVAWDFGHPGFNGDTMITGGTVQIGEFSQSVDFDTGSYGPFADVSGEYGFGNMDGTGLLTNFVSASTALATPFGGANLDGPVSIDGPQAGLISSLASLPLGGLGAIRDEIIITLTLSDPIFDLLFLSKNGTRVEFGSDAHFIDGQLVVVPAPAGIALLLAAAGLGRGRRRHA